MKKTGIQAIIGFSAILTQIQKSNSIDFLELRTAQAIENIQNFSYQKNYDFEIKSSVDKSTLSLVDLIDFTPKYDDAYLNSLHPDLI